MKLNAPRGATMRPVEGMEIMNPTKGKVRFYLKKLCTGWIFDLRREAHVRKES